MTDIERAVRRPLETLDVRTPNITAEAFRERVYPNATRRLIHQRGEFSCSIGGDAFAAVARENIVAEIYRFPDDRCDSQGRPFNPTPARVNAVLRCLAMSCQSIDTPRRAGT